MEGPILITFEQLSHALQVRGRLNKDIADDYADCLLEFFGFDHRITDNQLSSDDRIIFYDVEALGLLSTTREDVKLFDNRDWRIFYWELRADVIMKAAQQSIPYQMSSSVNQAEAIYKELSEDLWHARHY